LALVAIFLSFATTALSFGALALSSFVPVHVFGLTTAWAAAMLLSKTGGRDRKGTAERKSTQQA
jgi:membrane associated rhomboid family serine protease